MSFESWNALFNVAPEGWRSDAPRAISTLDGVGDRLRAAAFAEIQARDAFLWAADRYQDAPADLRDAWVRLAASEQRHLDWLLKRMGELGIDVKARQVSTHLWFSFMNCMSARDFAIFMANAEERGQRAGERFFQSLRSSDPTTAEIFRKIAEEEISHIALAARYFPGPELAQSGAVEQGSTRGPEV
jgi:uncharacterized ferritin-like protein (DUF455 family)